MIESYFDLKQRINSSLLVLEGDSFKALINS
jgi:hypothetical protein